MKKLQSKKGMTLSETLAAVLIMSLVTLAIAAGVTAGVRVYRRTRKKAEAQNLMATNIAALNDYIEKGYGIHCKSNEITIDNSEVTNTGIRIYNDEQRGIYIEYLDESKDLMKNGNSENSKVIDGQPLISDMSNTSDLYAELSSINVSNGQSAEAGNSTVTSYKISIIDPENNKPIESSDISVRSMVQYPSDSTDE